MDLYVVNGPYHAFTALCMKLQENCNDDGFLCVVDCFRGAAEIYQRMKESGAFKHVYLMPREMNNRLENSHGNRLVMVKRGLTYRCLNLRHFAFRRTPMYRERFERIYLAQECYAFQGLVLWQKKRYGTKLYLLDDGLGDRMRHHEGYHASKTEKLKRLFGYRPTSEYIEGQYFFSPEMVPKTLAWPLLRQKRPVLDESTKRLFASVFAYDAKSDQLNSIAVLYLCNGYDAANMPEYAKVDFYYATELAKHAENYAVKMHPRAQTKLPNIKLYQSDVPFELSCMFYDMNNKLLISPLSATVFNTKFVFDQEPYVVLLYKLIGMDNIASLLFNTTDAEWERMLHVSLLDAYRQPEKICIPETQEELFAFVKEYEQAEGRRL